jgi:bcr-type benzoyl-CoA reductase subunit C
MSIESMVNEFAAVAANPKGQLKAYKEAGFKCIGVMPYYAPEELVHAAGMVPFGMWGSNRKTIAKAKEYCATFYCTIAQLALEMMLDGTMDQLDGVITPTICDTLRPMSQNFRVSMAKLQKMPTIFLAHPQYRRPAFGLQFTVDQYTNVRNELDKIAGHKMTDEDIRAAIKVYNKFRQARREFVKLAGEHPEAVSAVNRSAVLKAGYFMEKPAYTEKLNELNAELAALPASNWNGVKIVTSGIICDNPVLLKIFDDNNVAIATDDVAHESRTIRVDADEEGDPMMALAKQFANEDYDVLLYDEASNQNRRGEFVANLVKESGAKGLVLFMQQFCDPEEMEYPYLKKALDGAGIPHIKLGIDQQMRDFGQAATAIQAFADVLSM